MTIQDVVHPTVLLCTFAGFWFLCFFCLIPVGLGEVDRETGSPKATGLKWKALCATVVATVLTAGFYAMILAGWLDL